MTTAVYDGYTEGKDLNERMELIEKNWIGKKVKVGIYGTDGAFSWKYTTTLLDAKYEICEGSGEETKTVEVRRIEQKMYDDDFVEKVCCDLRLNLYFDNEAKLDVSYDNLRWTNFESKGVGFDPKEQHCGNMGYEVGIELVG
jgi:hypothetical protein